MTSTTSLEPPVSRPAPLACGECRRKHLRCTGETPVCTRCVVNGLACIYTASRRGLGHRKRRSSRSQQNASVNGGDGHSNVAHGSTGQPIPSTISGTLQPQIRLPPLAPAPSTWHLSPAEHEHLLGLFYLHLFDAHPFIVPKTFYAAQHYPRHLDLAVCFAGHQFSTPVAGHAGLEHTVSLALLDIDEQTPHRVQTLVLYAIVFHARQQAKTATSCISRAAKIALDLGMNDPSFARANAADLPVREESLRRTWWELFTIDVYFAAIHRRPAFETITATTLPLLPCSQLLYEAGECDPDPPSLRAYEDRIFSAHSSTRFSSHCVRIEAIRIMGRLLTLTSTDAHPDQVQALDNALASWEYNLPPMYTDVVDSSGEVDLMLFQARCFISCTSIFLHYPRSMLPDTVPSAKDIACAREHERLASTSRHHTIKAAAASKDLSSLATVPWPLDRHSPFFICGLALGCIIQLAAGSIHLHQCGLDCLQQHKDRVALMVGALGRLGERWALAQNATRCLKVIGEAVFSPCEPRSGSFEDSGVDVGDFTGQPLWFDLFSVEGVDSSLLDI